MATTKIIIEDYDGGVDVKLECDEPMDMTNAADWTDAQRMAAEIYMQCGTAKRDVVTEPPQGSDGDVDDERGWNPEIHKNFCAAPPGAHPNHSKCNCEAAKRREDQL